MGKVDSTRIASVSEITRRVKEAVEDSAQLRYVKVRGEISNLTRRRSRFGTDYLYFVLKDEKTQLSAVMFEGVEDIPFEPRDGDVAVCEGMITVYEAYGKYQLKCYSMTEDGEGAAAQALEKLKKRLSEEGLFTQKRGLPRFPKKIAVVTSPTGAALQDIINVISRRYPITTLCVIPAYVQGENAVLSLVEGIKRAQSTNAELIIFGRGGGSSEDLDCFNSEILAREIFASKIPTISAVGHEIDFTIADLTADMRAPTPSAAAELAVPDITQLRGEIAAYGEKANYAIKRAVTDAGRELALLEKDVRLYSPRGRISEWEQTLGRLYSEISVRIHAKITEAENSLRGTAQSISDLNPLGVLSRGYALATAGGKVLRSSGELAVGDVIEVKFSDGGVSAAVTEIKER